jgi:hypothetical protein
MADERTLAFLRELERADEEAAAMLADLDELARQVDDVRTRAMELQAFLIRLPAVRDRLEASARESERRAQADRAELAGAEREAAEAERGSDDGRIAASRHRVTRARDVLHMAERRVDEVAAERAELDAEAGAAEREEADLGQRALQLARALRGRSRLAVQAAGQPAPGLAGAAEWASGARAALFVGRGALAAERGALIRQANELGAVVLGEPVLSGSAAQVARRVERAG